MERHKTGPFHQERLQVRDDEVTTLQTISHTPQELVLRYKSNPTEENKDLVFFGFKDLVQSRAKIYTKQIDFLEELISEGYRALVIALNRFDVETDLNFSTYATYYIDGYLRHYIRDKSCMIRIPSGLSDFKQKHSNAIVKLAIEGMNNPGSETIAYTMGITEQDYLEKIDKSKVSTVYSEDCLVDSESKEETIPRSIWVEVTGYTSEELEHIRDQDKITARYESIKNIVNSNIGIFGIVRHFRITPSKAVQLVNGIKTIEKENRNIEISITKVKMRKDKVNELIKMGKPDAVIARKVGLSPKQVIDIRNGKYAAL